MKSSVKKFLFVQLACLTSLVASAQIASPLGRLPLCFEAEPNQANAATQFIARGCDAQFLISADEAQMALRKSTAEAAVVQMRFVGANPSAQIHGDTELAGKINYLVGNDPARWRSDISTFAKVSVEEIYPGIGLVYYGNQRRLEYDFTIAPGANPNAIAIRFDGADKLSIDNQGELVLILAGGKIHQPKPVIYQMVGGARQSILGGYKILDAHTVAFSIVKYDRTLPLVIDPQVTFSSYFGGGAGETAWAIAVNTNDGSIYITGQTLSQKFGEVNNAPVPTTNAFQAKFGGGSSTGDAFVAKFDSSGQNLLYMTYLGGNDDDVAYGIAVDNMGDAFVTGFTASKNFPTTNAIYPKINGPFYSDFDSYAVDAFVTELDPGGSNLVYSTYLGGEAADIGYGIAVDSSGNAYVTGTTYSTNYPTTNAIQDHLACPNSFYYNANAFISEIATGGSNLVFSTYYGGKKFEEGRGIAVDANGFVYVTGYSASTNFPVWNVPTNLPGGSWLNASTKNSSAKDAFVVKFPQFSTNWVRSASGQTYSISNLVYSTYLGGAKNDIGRAIAFDAVGDAFVTGNSSSSNFPNTSPNIPGLYSFVATNRTATIATNAFLSEINADGTTLLFSTLFGGKKSDVGNALALDPAGDIFVAGSTTSGNFPTTNTFGALSSKNSGKNDIFITAFNATTTALLYSAYMGGKSNDYCYGVALDSIGNAYITGKTLSSGFPTILPIQSSLKGNADAFIAEIVLDVGLPQITNQPTNQDVGVGDNVTFNVTATGTTPFSYQWQLDGTNLVNKGHISGVTSTALTISSAQTTNSGNYQVIISNGAGMVTSSVVVLTVTNVFPLITTQPVSQTIEVGAGSVGGFIYFSITNSAGTPPETYQWVKDGTNLVNGGTNAPGAAFPDHIYGATNTTLFIVDPQTNDEGTYWLIITNPAGVVTSSNATLTVVSFPTIVTPPTNQTVGLGSTVTFVVKVFGTAPLGYQWQLGGMNLTNGTNTSGSIITIISSSTNSTLIFNNVQTSDDGGYSVIVTNSVGSATSSPPAVLTVLTVPIFTSITMNTNGGFVITGTGGTSGANYDVYASTNLAFPLSQWTELQLNTDTRFGSQGQFIFTYTPPTNTPQQFYILKVP